MKLRRALLPILAASMLVSCEFRERPDDEPAELEATRAVPPSELRDRLGPVFAPPEEAPLVVGDEFWAGSGTVGYELVAGFVSREALHLTLDPAQPVGVYGDRRWTLSDILVAVDFRGDRYGAIWRVAGPSDVVEAYVTRLEEGVPRGAPITELGILPLEVRSGS